jgi:phytoene dehydrogenase-like protein
VLWREVRTPADLEAATRAPGGSIYGTSSNGPRAAFLRPANRGPVPGLFLVGGSSHPGGGLPLVGLSAEIVAGLVGPA